jgi:hypothetical protein
MKLINAIQKFYTGIQKPFSFICLIVAVASNFGGSKELQLTSLLAIGFVLLQILFEIHSTLSEQKENAPKIFESYHIASPEMERLIDDQIKRNKSISLKWLGTCMDYGWPFLRNYLVKLMSLNLDVSVKVEVAMLAPDWSDVAKVNLFWQIELKSQHDAIEAFIKSCPNKNIEVKLHTYRHMPYFTGLLINDKFLFLGLCQWSAGQYAVGSNHYTLYTKGKASEHEEQIVQYQSWFSLCSGSHSVVNPNP